MRCIGFNGILCENNSVWTPLESALRRRIAISEFVVEEELNCKLWQVRRFRRYIRNVVQKHDTGGKALLIGHSLGGVAACAAVRLFKCTEIVGIVSICAPHTLYGGVCQIVFGGYRRLSVPILTFEGLRDQHVSVGARHPQSLRHTELDSDHYYELCRKPQHAAKIADVTAEMHRLLPPEF